MNDAHRPQTAEARREEADRRRRRHRVDSNRSQHIEDLLRSQIKSLIDSALHVNAIVDASSCEADRCQSSTRRSQALPRRVSLGKAGQCTTQLQS